MEMINEHTKHELIENDMNNPDFDNDASKVPLVVISNVSHELDSDDLDKKDVGSDRDIAETQVDALYVNPENKIIQAIPDLTATHNEITKIESRSEKVDIPALEEQKEIIEDRLVIKTPPPQIKGNQIFSLYHHLRFSCLLFYL